MTVAITCAGCRRTLRVDESRIGQAVRCPLCIEIFAAEADLQQPPPPAAKPAPRRRGTAVADNAVVATLAEEDLPTAEAVAEEPTRPTTPFKPVPFSVLFTHDPDRLFRGRAEVEVSLDGLRVRLRNRRDLWVSVCGLQPARYLGGNRIAVFLDGREVTLTLVRERTDLNRLARDVVAFLNGGRAELTSRAYRLPWKLTLLPWLALAVPCLAIWLRVLGGVHNGGRFLWVLLAGSAVFLGIKSVRRETLSTGRRLAGAGIAVGACFLLLAAAGAYRLANPNTVPAGAWRRFTPPGQRAHLLMPGEPQTNRQKIVAGINSVVYTVTVYSHDKTFALSIGTVERQHIFGGDNPLNVLEDRRRELEREVLIYGSGMSEHVVLKSGAVAVQIAMTPKYPGPGGQREPRISRLILVGDRLFTLTVSGPELETDDPDVKKFFDSFAIDPAPVVVAPTDLPGVVGYWSFDDFPLDGPDQERRSFYHNLHQTEGIRKQAGEFNGSGYVAFDGHPNLNFGENEPFSCVGWFNVSRANPSGHILCMRSEVGERSLLELSLDRGFLIATINNVDRCRVGATGKELAPLNDGNWHHFALTRSASGRFSLYLDGSSGEAHVALLPFTSGPLTTTVRSLGCRRTARWLDPDSFLAGDLDEVAIFNRCLTADEVARLGRIVAPDE